MKLQHKDKLKKVIKYFNTKESKWGYTLLLKGTKHFGYYPKGQENISMVKAQRLMEGKLAERLKLPFDSLILDAGCGEGNVAIHLAQQYKYRIYGIDLLDFAIKKSVSKSKELISQNRVKFEVGDYTSLRFKDETFDGVYTMETLVHVPNYKKALKEFHRVLKPGGKLVLFEYSVAPQESFSPEHRKIANMIFEGTAAHSLPYFLHGNFPEILRTAGFKNITVENITPRVMPMLRKFYLIANLPYRFIKLLGLQRKFINVTSAVEGNKGLHKGDYGRYNIVTAIKH